MSSTLFFPVRLGDKSTDPSSIYLRALVYLLLCWVISGCGFQLRGQANLPVSMNSTYLAVPGDLQRELRLLLRGNDVLIASDRAKATAILSVTNEQLEREVQSVGERARVSEYALHYSLDFDVKDANGETVVASQPIELVRDYTLDETQILGVASEEEIIRKELRRDMAREIVRRLEYAR